MAKSVPNREKDAAMNEWLLNNTKNNAHALQDYEYFRQSGYSRQEARDAVLARDNAKAEKAKKA